MAYSKQNFVNGDVLMAEHLNAIEDQVLLNSNHNHDSLYDTKGAAVTAEANAKVYTDSVVLEALKAYASQSWVTEQIQLAIDAVWEASY